MLDIHFIREQADIVKAAAAKKKVEVDIDRLLAVDEERKGLLQQLPLALDARGNVQTDGAYMSSVPGVFSAGDARRGQSLVVWAIAEGRKAAHHIDKFLTGSTQLPM